MQFTYAAEGDADVLEVIATHNGNNGWTFSVTVAHPDTGWDEYCNGWDVVTNSGQVLKQRSSDPFTRLLHHPHETEQPFTRSQSGIEVPEGTTTLTVRAHDLKNGFGGKVITLDLQRSKGPGYQIRR